MRAEVLAFYERWPRGGTGLISRRVSDHRLPGGLPAGATATASTTTGSSRASSAARRGHPQARLPDLHADEPRRPLAVASGLRADPPYSTGRPYAASPVIVACETDFHNEVPKELTIPEIEGLVEQVRGGR